MASSTEKKHMVNGFQVTTIDNRTQGGARFSAYYDVLGGSVVGHGETRKDAIADLKTKAEKRGTEEHARREREEWAEHEAQRERELRMEDE